MDKTHMVRVQHHLTAKQLAELRRLSAKTGANVSELIRRAIDSFLKGNK